MPSTPKSFDAVFAAEGSTTILTPFQARGRTLRRAHGSVSSRHRAFPHDADSLLRCLLAAPHTGLTPAGEHEQRLYARVGGVLVGAAGSACWSMPMDADTTKTANAMKLMKRMVHRGPVGSPATGNAAPTANSTPARTPTTASQRHSTAVVQITTEAAKVNIAAGRPIAAMAAAFAYRKARTVVSWSSGLAAPNARVSWKTVAVSPIRTVTRPPTSTRREAICGPPSAAPSRLRKPTTKGRNSSRKARPAR